MIGNVSAPPHAAPQPTRRWIGMLALLAPVARIAPALAGLPEMVKPEYQETGAPTFTMPAQGNGSMGSSTSQPGGTQAGPANPGAGGGNTNGVAGAALVGSGYQQYLGQSVGSGQCVALLQAVDPNVGRTATWSQGDPVRGNISLQPGTAIATFGPNGTYTNSMDGSSHAAIYLGQNSEGIQVQDQWLNHPASVRTIYWDRPGNAVNNGSLFHVVTHAT